MLLLVFMANGLHEKYPDEFDSILGGRYIAEGLVIYRDFFTHHGPVAYFIAALVYFFSGQSFVRFRVVYSVLLFVWTVGSYLFIRRRTGQQLGRFYPLFMVTSALLATFIWSHMLLADSLAANLFAPLYALIFLKVLNKIRLTLADISFVSLTSFLILFSSLTYTYIVAIIIIFCLWVYVSSNKYRLFSKEIGAALAIVGLPYVLFAGYLLATRSLGDYLFQNFQFNLEYYIYNYPRPEGVIRVNPMRYAVLIAHEFFNNFHVLVTRIRDFGFDFPLNVTFTLGNLTVLTLLFFKRKYVLAGFVILMMIYANVRSNPLSFGEKDYQSAVYVYLSLVNSAAALILIKDHLKLIPLQLVEKITLITMFLLLGSHFVASEFFIFRSFFDKVYGKYMGTAPLIYDRPEIAPVINAAVKDGSTMWVGPFHFEELFYTRSKPASKYHILIPGLGKSQRAQQEMINDLQRTRPKVVWLDVRYFILGSSPLMHGMFLIDYLKQDYIRLLDYRDNGLQYKSIKPVTTYYDPEVHLFIRRDVKDEVIRNLLEAGVIRSVASGMEM